jgi:hypothetical protein
MFILIEEISSIPEYFLRISRSTWLSFLRPNAFLYRMDFLGFFGLEVGPGIRS